MVTLEWGGLILWASWFVINIFPDELADMERRDAAILFGQSRSAQTSGKVRCSLLYHVLFFMVIGSVFWWAVHLKNENYNLIYDAVLDLDDNVLLTFGLNWHILPTCTLKFLLPLFCCWEQWSLVNLLFLSDEDACTWACEVRDGLSWEWRAGNKLYESWLEQHISCRLEGCKNDGGWCIIFVLLNEGA